ncbi:hypothetical protein CCR94_03550 [Rhodoblastus sphagnicola]|uniref:DUF6644 domain-containing protein n=1 Tax=Rhodoblastus sphagnicola TaxID=333368 RepID=A0A2S6NE93_9HYPH|nr:DUF6644 family protein [Rhodoblastus sphagnicola]MBB4199897.1 putative membrane protein SirB2 [Rhodoblastus sphagnicola]PPQ32952.1 hypothetical protein CCR94_03550 [Rhodoblastus sphagnicola]
MSLHEFCLWVEKTDLSMFVKSNDWVVPTLQTIHILCVAIILSSILMMTLRIIGIIGKDESVQAFAARFLPWIWYTIPTLAIGGLLQISAEPERSLSNKIFQTKMVLLVAAMAGMVALGRKIHAAAGEAPSPAAGTIQVKFIGMIVFSLWIAIIAAGRWIAYAIGL